jgi:diacylglycerol kinase
MIRIKRLGRSFQYASRGLVKVFKEEQNFKVELSVAVVVMLVALILKVNRLELIALIIVSGLVLVMEIINSAIESISDALKPKLDIYVRRIKDIVAAGVMVAAFTAVLVGLIIFSQYI